jgi:hypothetical protein
MYTRMFKYMNYTYINTYFYIFVIFAYFDICPSMNTQRLDAHNEVLYMTATVLPDLISTSYSDLYVANDMDLRLG